MCNKVCFYFIYLLAWRRKLASITMRTENKNPIWDLTFIFADNRSRDLYNRKQLKTSKQAAHTLQSHRVEFGGAPSPRAKLKRQQTEHSPYWHSWRKIIPLLQTNTPKAPGSLHTSTSRARGRQRNFPDKQPVLSWPLWCLWPETAEGDVAAASLG